MECVSEDDLEPAEHFIGLVIALNVLVKLEPHPIQPLVHEVFNALFSLRCYIVLVYDLAWSGLLVTLLLVPVHSLGDRLLFSDGANQLAASIHRFYLLIEIISGLPNPCFMRRPSHDPECIEAYEGNDHFKQERWNISTVDEILYFRHVDYLLMIG